MIDLSNITDADVRNKIQSYLNQDIDNNLRTILLCALKLSYHFSFIENRTYPRPDHPDINKRKPLIFMLVAILISLRTTLENEQKAVSNLIAKFPTSDELFNADIETIEECIRPAGMANKKAITIKNAIKYVKENFNGKLESLASLETEEARKEILKIKGVGSKSADCLLSIGLGKPSIAVDVNVFRVTSWIFATEWAENADYSNEKQVSAVKKILDDSLPKDAFICQIVHTYFLLFGKSLGSSHPKNKLCLLHENCNTCNNNKVKQNLLF